MKKRKIACEERYALAVMQFAAVNLMPQDVSDYFEQDDPQR
jgi:hypothetical protein